MRKKLLNTTLILFNSFLVLSQTWVQKNNFGGSARLGAYGFALGGKAYAGTGHDGAYKNDFWEYDPVGDTWTQLANFPGTARYGACGFGIGTKGYYGLGENGGKFGDFWEYSPPPSNTWVSKATFGGSARSWPVAFAINSKGYVVSGNTGGYSNECWEYDPASDSWTKLGNFSGTAREQATGFAIGNKGYVGTGYNAGAHYNDFWEYDPPPADTWTQKANFGGSIRKLAVGFAINNKGFIGTGVNSGTRYRDFWEYDPSANSWTAKANFGGTVRSAAIGFSIGLSGFIGTGTDGSRQNDIWEYTDPLLPIQLLDFSAKWLDETHNVALLEWETVNEINNDRFEIERSIDALNFTKIGSVQGSGTTTEKRQYEFHDEQPYKEGSSYYRLKQIDFDGSHEYSHIEILDISENFDIVNLYPNPASDQFGFTLQSPIETEIKLSIVNSIGQLIKTQTQPINSGLTTINVNVNNLESGNYYLQIVTIPKKYQVQRKFVVNKDL